MAKLKLRVPTLDGLPKELTSFYRQMDGGGFILDHEDDPDGYGIDRLPVIRGKLAEKERDLERLNERLKLLRKQDGSLYTAEELLANEARSAQLAKELEILKDKTKTDEQKLAEMVAQAKRPLEAELARFKTEREGYRAKVIQAEKTKLIAKAKQLVNPLPEWEDAIEDAIARRLDIRERDGGDFEHVIMEDGKPRMSSLMGKDGPMSVDEFVKSSDFRTKYGKYLKGDNKKGADVGGNDQTAVAEVVRSGADISLPRNYTQQQFEKAFQQARENGGQVVFADQGGESGS